MTRRSHTQAATTAALAWTIYEAEDFNVPRIDLSFDAAPTSAGLITITKDSVEGAAYDTVIRTINPVGIDAVVFEGLHGFVNGDKIVVAYANPDSVEITGTASVEIPLPLEDLSVGELTAVNGTIRSGRSAYRRYYHLGLGDVTPGASGATWEPSDANAIAGWLLNSPTEFLYSETDIHDDWDSSSNPKLESAFTVMTAGASPTDVVSFQFTICYKSDINQTTRTQILTAERVVGLIPQYTLIKAHVDIPRDAEDNPIQHGDILCLQLQLNASSDITAVRINSASITYNTTHVGIEEGDV